MRYLCSICVRRDADTLDEIDGKHRPVCLACVDESVPDCDFIDEHSPKYRALRAVRAMPGSTFKELREVLGVPGPGDSKVKRVSTPDSRECNKYNAVLIRLVKAGKVLRTGKWPHWQYWPVDQQRRAA